MNTTTGFKLLLQKAREYRKFFVRVLLNTVHKKKKIWACFIWNPFLAIWGQILAMNTTIVDDA